MSRRAGTRGGLARPALLAIGAAAIAVGIALTLRPFSSLDALTFFVAASLILAGLSELVGSGQAASPTVSLAKGLETSPAGMLFASLLVAGYSNAYPDVHFDDYIRPSAQAVVRSVVGRCLSEPATLLSLPAMLPGEHIFSRHLTTCRSSSRARR